MKVNGSDLLYKVSQQYGVPYQIVKTVLEWIQTETLASVMRGNTVVFRNWGSYDLVFLDEAKTKPSFKFHPAASLYRTIVNTETNTQTNTQEPEAKPEAID